MSRRIDAQWWSERNADQRHSVVFEVVRRLRNALEWRFNEFDRFARLYNGSPAGGLSWRTRAASPVRSSASKLTYNIGKSCVDTYVAKVSKEQPKVTLQTDGGDWDLQERADGMMRFLDATFYSGGLKSCALSCVQDSAMYGLAYVEPYIDEDAEGRPCIRYERVYPNEIVVDEAEAIYGEPRSIYRLMLVEREVLKAMFPRSAADIDGARSDDMTEVDLSSIETTGDMVLVIKAWHLRSGANTNDGVHCICVSNATLVEEEFDEPELPFSVLRRQPPPAGWWSPGLIEDVQGIQYELNELTLKRQHAARLMGTGFWIVQKNSVNPQKITNGMATILEHNGVEPKVYWPNAWPPDLQRQIDELWQKGFEVCGLSQLSATSQKPAGLNSGEAQRVYLDVQTERFGVSLKLYHAWYLDIARKTLRLAKKIADSNPDFGADAFDNGTYSRVVFSDVFLEDNQYRLQMFETNAFANDPAAKLDYVMKLADAGWLDRNDAMRLADLPDVKSLESYEFSDYNVVMKIIGLMSHEGRYVGPEPFMNLEDAKGRVQRAYLKYKCSGLDEERLQLFRDWLLAADGMLNPKPPSAPPGAPMPGGPMPPMPPGPPGPPGPPLPSAPPGMPPGPPPGPFPADMPPGAQIPSDGTAILPPGVPPVMPPGPPHPLP